MLMEDLPLFCPMGLALPKPRVPLCIDSVMLCIVLFGRSLCYISLYSAGCQIYIFFLSSSIYSKSDCQFDASV